MDNKKLLNFLLKDLNELDELFSEKENGVFDSLEIEFVLTRVKGAKKLVQLLINKETGIEITPPEVKSEEKPSPEPIQENVTVAEEEKVETRLEEPIIEMVQDIDPEPEVLHEEINENPEPVSEEIEEISLPEETGETITEEIQETPAAEEVELDDTPLESVNKRLGDSFSIEKSVNDLMADDSSKLEHKLSNRPLTSIQSAINLNDRFQFIRELFEGNAEEFSKTVTDIDGMNNLKEAVNYLQQNFKWKKNDISLKFVTLVKRRFPNE